MADVRKKSADKPLWKHIREKHDGRMEVEMFDHFRMELTGIFSSAQRRKANEGVRISRACLTVRFTVKNGDPPEHGKIWENRFFTGKMDHQGHETPQTYETTCHLGCGTCQNFFSFTFVAVGVTFLKVILKLLRRMT